MTTKEELYVKMEDISKEMSNYKRHFADKTVLVECADTEYSNVWKYFHVSYSELKLAGLMAIVRHEDGTASVAEYYGGDDNDRRMLIQKTVDGAGDPLSEGYRNTIAKADIIVSCVLGTTLTDKLIKWMEFNKSFIAVANHSCTKTKPLFFKFVENEMWFGYNKISTLYTKNGEEKKINSGCWLTNLDILKRHNKLVPDLRYSYSKHPDWYPKYDNCDAINIGYVGNDSKLQRTTNKVDHIPFDYDGIMGVPATFLERYNPDEFEVLGNENNMFADGVQLEGGHFLVDGVKMSKRILIRRKKSGDDV